MRQVEEAHGRDPAPPVMHAEPRPKNREKTKARAKWQFPALFTKRRLLSLWLPAALIAGAALIAFNWQSIRNATLNRAEAVRTAVINHPEFAVTDLEISGHIQLSVHEIGRIVGIKPGTRSISSLRFDARQARETLLANPWIERASVAVDPSGVMKISIIERIPVAVWRNDEGFFLIDDTGHAIVSIGSADERLDLPLLIGTDANKAVADAQALLQAAPSEALPRIVALVRRGSRRWDLVTDSGLVVKLPADNPLDALRLFIDRQLEKRLLPFAVTGIDLRLPDEPPVIRLEPGTSEMRDELLRTLRTTYR